MMPRPSTDSRVIIVDDDQSVRDSLRWMLEAAHMNVTCHASAEALLDNLDWETPGCLILDVRMPGMSGLELQEALKARRVPLPVIILTGHGDVPMAVKAMAAGAFGFAQKPFDGKKLLADIHKAVERSRTLIAERKHLDALQARFDRLTPRETEVLDRIVQGQANKVIASEMRIVERTVEVHRHNVMEKMQAGSVAELTKMVLLLRATA